MLAEFTGRRFQGAAGEITFGRLVDDARRSERLAADLHCRVLNSLVQLTDGKFDRRQVVEQLCIAPHLRHVEGGRQNKAAIVWEGDDGEVRKLTYRELLIETNRLANALRALGVDKGDRVGVFLPMLLETVVATLACGKLGAIYLPMFSGFGPEAVNRLILGLGSLIAASLYGAVFSRGERFTMKVMEDFRMASITDFLTGLHNYAYFIDRLKHEQYRADRDNSHFSVIIFDLDRFKQVNDTYGHEKGNVLLKAVAGIIAMNARGMDTVARYGGEEFVILMPDSRGAELEMAERIRQAIEDARIDVGGHVTRTTVSVGVASYPADGSDPATMIEKADGALYKAKRAGRNRVATHSDSQATLPFDDNRAAA